MIWYLSAKMILLGRAYRNILFENLNISGKISYSRPSSFYTFVYQTSLFENCLSQMWSIFVWPIAGHAVCARFISYAICLFGDQQSHTPSCTECPVLAHLGPNKESVHEHLLAVRSSGPGIEVHDLYNGQTNFIFDIKWTSFDVKIAFWKLIFKFIFLHVL